jgi:hypothetical protein
MVELPKKRLYTCVMSQKFRPLLLSFLFLLISVGTYQLGTTYLEPTATTATTTETPAGTWRQYVIDDGEPIYLATFTFVEERGDFKVVANDVAPVTFPQSDFRTFAHKYDGQHWGFHSDWHEYGVAWFELEKVDDGRYEGYAYLDGERRPNRHILIRVE